MLEGLYGIVCVLENYWKLCQAGGRKFFLFFFFLVPVGGYMKDCKSFSSPQHFESFLILSVVLLVRHLKAIQGQPSRQPLSEYKGDGWGIHGSSEFCPFLGLFFVPTELITWNSTEEHLPMFQKIFHGRGLRWLWNVLKNNSYLLVESY